jgi:hypothetical protein
MAFVRAAGFEALLFMLGRVVDWLASTQPAQLFVRLATRCGCWGAGRERHGVVALQTAVKPDPGGEPLPMRLRWNFHRLMEPEHGYRDEFAGRLTTRSCKPRWRCGHAVCWLAHGGVCSHHGGVLAGAFDLRLVAPFIVWAVHRLAVLFVPRLGHIGKL